MITTDIKPVAGAFAENKDVARDLRIKVLMPALARGEIVTLNFVGVKGTTQSFIHALISEAFRKYKDETLERIFFKNCNQTMQKVITIVTEYMQEAE